MKPHNRISSLESSRGLLALWVVVGHVLRHAGYREQDLGIAKFLVEPGLAVDVFIMISGFVIFFLLDQQRTSTLHFLVRRWFRLMPVFLFVLIASALTLNWQLNVISTTPWQGDAVMNDLAIHLDTAKYFVAHLLAHITLLHGLISDHILPNSQYAFIGQAWSISVEWQFYLVAPFIFHAVIAKKWNTVASLLIAVCVLRSLNYSGEGFAVNQAGYFLIGMLSYFIWKRADQLSAIDFRLIEVAALVLIALSYFLIVRSLSPVLWIALMTCMLAEQHDSPGLVQQYLGRLLNHPLLRWCGKISYSVYMVHMLVIYAIQYSILTMWPHIEKIYFVALMLPLAVAGTLGLAVFSWTFIEAPGIELGRRVSAYVKVPAPTVIG
ncbi:acyltransferase family protein [Solimicrobium silvestre]|uniref:Acyltransferase family n=1 Tax=Solimicrobium silvestre TaxID=2099400 RepID=A0A2S9GTE0_9BURK|nr:acyltransferase [Solimicrobium silvestre]PRC90958.1 Acyltransferase family [Solimicrobium silvestre]